MKKHLLRRRTGWGLELALLTIGVTGCSELNWNLQPPSPQRAAAPTQAYRAPTTSKMPPAKPAEATDDQRDRHPSMWKRKLKATFT